MLEFIALAQQCAPNVHISTLAAVVRHESGFNPLAIGVNSKPHRSIRPKSREEATEHARKLIAAGVDFDVGFGQINVRNWKWLGVDEVSIFDPCVNLRAAERVLVGCYQRAVKELGPGQPALYGAFSCYNTGNLQRGFQNGYVGKVLAGAGLKVPAINATGGQRQFGGSKSKSRKYPPIGPPDAFASPPSDAFASQPRDAFAANRRDVFTKHPDSPFGHRKPLRRPADSH